MFEIVFVEQRIKITRKEASGSETKLLVVSLKIFSVLDSSNSCLQNS